MTFFNIFMTVVVLLFLSACGTPGNHNDFNISINSNDKPQSGQECNKLPRCEEVYAEQKKPALRNRFKRIG